ncbi:unnamed protein product [Didymodactylos carnosus]|uniref:Uncharacterized protein n=1 Tax=Didymodactylos carnosus TaxID=1234261 RepID=A0A815KUJ4_9BILA|nr:unnamed protein product [Didymodactylos carnosus]CAF4289875.1 unnamed protein product [Didymodactylos carnosus]
MLGASPRKLMTHINREDFRNLVHKLDPKFDFKRQHIRSSDSLEKIIEILQEIEKYKLKILLKSSSSTNNDDQPMLQKQYPLLFIQEDFSAGGIGSYLVSKDEQIYKINNNLTFNTLDEIGSFIKKKNVDMIIAPYYEYKNQQPPNPSIGIILTDNGVSAFIVGNQRLDQNGGYYGIDISLNCFTSDIKTYFDQHHQRLLTLAIRLAQHEQQMGRRGYGSIDTFMYLDNRHELRMGISEENPRFTGVCPILMTVIGHNKMRQFILEHCRLPCIISNDHTIVNVKKSSVLSLKTTHLTQILIQNHVPLFTSNNLEGVIILNCPQPPLSLHEENTDQRFRVALAIIALTEQKRNEIQTRLEDVINSHF